MIEWHKVTWYSKLLAFIVFLGTFCLAFDLGALWEQSHLLEAVPLQAVPQLSSLSATPETGTTTNATSSPDWTSGMTVVTGESEGQIVHLTKNERFAIRLGDTLSWTLSFDPANGITRVADSVSTGGYQGVYEAAALGTTTLTALGRPICANGEWCPQFIQNVSIIFVIGS